MPTTMKNRGTKKRPAVRKKRAAKKVPKKLPAKKSKGPIKGHMKLLESWAEFVTVPITRLNGEQLLEMLNHEKSHGKRWSFINRLHGAYNAKRVKAERDDLRRKYQ